MSNFTGVLGEKSSDVKMSKYSDTKMLNQTPSIHRGGLILLEIEEQLMIRAQV